MRTGFLSQGDGFRQSNYISFKKCFRRLEQPPLAVSADKEGSLRTKNSEKAKLFISSHLSPFYFCGSHHFLTNAFYGKAIILPA